MWILTGTAILKSEIFRVRDSSNQYTQRRDVFPWVRSLLEYITLKFVLDSSNRRQYIGFLLWDFEVTSPKTTEGPDYGVVRGPLIIEIWGSLTGSLRQQLQLKSGSADYGIVEGPLIIGVWGLWPFIYVND